MSASGTTSRRGGADRSTAIRQLPSHAHLLRDYSRRFTPTGRSRRSRLNAIIVPTARPASSLVGLIELAASLGILLVVLCSKQATIAQVVERVGRTARARALVVQVGEDYRLPMPLGFDTSEGRFAKASGGRASDLSLKRNLGLLLAETMDWSKIAFVDDDVMLSDNDLTRMAFQLEAHGIAAMACRHFPDNSVFCHARRLAELPQDVFVTGAVLGVNCDAFPPPFFPDVYNEDWFFFGEAAARRRLVKSGNAYQAPYEPFADPMRALHEEFGDLLAEGLYALIENVGPDNSFRQITHWATEAYWASFTESRREDAEMTRDLLARFVEGADVESAMASLAVTEDHYRDGWITPESCVGFLDAWERDSVRWGKFCASLDRVRTISEAMQQLELTTWASARCRL